MHIQVYLSIVFFFTLFVLKNNLTTSFVTEAVSVYIRNNGTTLAGTETVYVLEGQVPPRTNQSEKHLVSSI